MLANNFAPQRRGRRARGDGQTDFMITVGGQDLRVLGLASDGDQHDLIFAQIGHSGLNAKGGWSGGGSIGSIKSKRGRPRVGLHAKQTAPILNLARDVGRPIGSLPGISQGRFEAAIFREVEGLALKKARQDAKKDNHVLLSAVWAQESPCHGG